MEAIQNAGLVPSDLDWLLLHQANIRIMEHAAEVLGISMDKVLRNIAEYGNTSAGTPWSIPLSPHYHHLINVTLSIVTTFNITTYRFDSSCSDRSRVGREGQEGRHHRYLWIRCRAQLGSRCDPVGWVSYNQYKSVLLYMYILYCLSIVT